MTPEELEHNVEFIIDSQARLAAAQEKDRHDRIKFEGWSKGLFSQMAGTDARLSRLLELQTQLLNHQSERMDRIDKFYEDWLKQNDGFQQQVLDLQRQALHLLNLILDRLPPSSPNPN